MLWFSQGVLHTSPAHESGRHFQVAPIGLENGPFYIWAETQGTWAVRGPPRQIHHPLTSLLYAKKTHLPSPSVCCSQSRRAVAEPKCSRLSSSRQSTPMPRRQRAKLSRSVRVLSSHVRVISIGCRIEMPSPLYVQGRHALALISEPLVSSHFFFIWISRGAFLSQTRQRPDTVSSRISMFSVLSRGVSPFLAILARACFLLGRN